MTKMNGKMTKDEAKRNARINYHNYRMALVEAIKRALFLPRERPFIASFSFNGRKRLDTGVYNNGTIIYCLTIPLYRKRIDMYKVEANKNQSALKNMQKAVKQLKGKYPGIFRGEAK